MFDQLVPGYDQFNRIGSLGLDGSWRRELTRILKEKKCVLDVGTGTGELAFDLSQCGAQVTGVDFSEPMILRAQRKYKNLTRLKFQVAHADHLPFETHYFDGLSSAFLIRNLHFEGILDASFREFFRVLKPEGCMVHLELTRPSMGFLKWGHDVYLRSILPLVGRLVFGSRWPKRYLRDTIQGFIFPEEICQRMRWAGFSQISHYPLSGEIAGLFVGVKEVT